MQELNLDLHSVKTSRIQLIRNPSSYPQSFSMASHSHVGEFSPIRNSASQVKITKALPQQVLNRLESQLKMAQSSSGRTSTTRQLRNNATATPDLKPVNTSQGSFAERVLLDSQSGVNIFREHILPHVNSNQQIVVGKIGGQLSTYARQSKHQRELDTAGPSAHYLDFDETQMTNNKMQKNNQAFEQDPLLETVYGANFQTNGQSLNENANAMQADHLLANMDQTPLIAARAQVLTKQVS